MSEVLSYWWCPACWHHISIEVDSKKHMSNHSGSPILARCEGQLANGAIKHIREKKKAKKERAFSPRHRGPSVRGFDTILENPLILQEGQCFDSYAQWKEEMEEGQAEVVKMFERLISSQAPATGR